MPEIEIHPAQPEEIDQLIALEHGYYRDFVWQMNLDLAAGNAQADFRRIRLPRKVFVPYPRKRDQIFKDFDQIEALLVADYNEQPVGYVKVQTENNDKVLKVADLVISDPMRRKGIGSGLLLAVMELALHRNFHMLILEIQSKNDPAILMASKLFFSRFTR